jgi:hypothetical protein
VKQIERYPRAVHAGQPSEGMPPQKDDFIEKEIVQAFDLYDADHSGAIDATELRSALQAVGLTVTGTQVDFMLRKYDDDRNMTLQLPEFAQLVRDLKINSPESVQRRNCALCSR